MLRTKNQGQSTVEYLLVVTVASFFVLSLWVYMDPRLSSMLSNMEDIVAAKIRGGELVSHYKGGAGAGGGGGETTDLAEKGGEAQGSAEEGGTEEKGAGERAEGISSPRLGVSDLGEDSGKASTVATVSGGGGGGGEAESSSSVALQAGRAAKSSQGSAVSSKQTPEGKKEKSATEEDKSSKGRGILYQEGQEEEAIGGSQFNWMRFILMLLIFIVVVFMAFEIYKSLKLSRK